MGATASDGFPSPSDGRVAFVGDTHGNARWAAAVIAGLAAEGVRTIVQVGDFGWCPQGRFGRAAAAAAVRAGADLLFIDGNHEHHPALRAAAVRADPDGALGRPVRMRPGLWYLPRGSRWEWDGVRFAALGGAYSVDSDGRAAGKDWFPDLECPSEAEADRTVRGGPADVLVCHDYPELGYRLPSMPGLEPRHQEASREVQLLLGGVARAVGCGLVVHGHWHRRYTAEAGGAAVEGLDGDDSAFGAVVVDLGTLEAEDWITPAPGTLRGVLG